MEFIAQPFGDVRLGEFLLTHLADPHWTAFRAAIAFVKRSGTQFIREPLRNFSARARVKISVGIDFYGTSREGLMDLLEGAPGGEIFIYRNNGPYTFHPKVYLFKSATRADVLVGPTSPTPAFDIGAKVDDPITMYLNDIYTIGANLAGLPAMSVPCGFVGNLPVGLQLIGPHFGESRILAAAHAYQCATDFHRRLPGSGA